MGDKYAVSSNGEDESGKGNKNFVGPETVVIEQPSGDNQPRRKNNNYNNDCCYFADDDLCMKSFILNFLQMNIFLKQV